MNILDEIIDYRAILPLNPNVKLEERKKEIKIIVLHSTEMDWDVFQTAKYHITPNENHHIDKNGCPSICYHYFIDRHGKIYYCVDEKYKTWHVGIWNSFAVGIVMDYLGGDNLLPKEVYESAVKTAAFLINKYKLTEKNIYGHRELPVTGFKYDSNRKKIYRKECPGRLVDLNKFRDDVKKILY